MQRKNLLWMALLGFTFSFGQKSNLYIGTYTQKCDSKGIYTANFDPKTGKINLLNHTEKSINPSYLAFSDNKLYAVNEFGKESTLSAFGINNDTFEPKLMSQSATKGEDPCYLIVNKKHIFTANYTGGNISVFSRNESGNIDKLLQVISFEGKGQNPQRQEAPHLHMLAFSADNRYVYASDLGTDKIYKLKYNPEQTENVLTLESQISMHPGSGPRHFVFSKNDNFMYVIEELSSKIAVIKNESSVPKTIQEISLLAANTNNDQSAADIHISADGQFLYATNRGDANTITVFKILKNGKLEQIQQLKTEGKGPRNFVIDPTQKYILVAHQYTNNIVVFVRNQKTGKLSYHNQFNDICSPVCLKFF